MKISELFDIDQPDLTEGGKKDGKEDWLPKLCRSSKSNKELGASNLAACKSRGLRAREGGKSHKVGDKRVKVDGKKIKGAKHGGPLPDWS